MNYELVASAFGTLAVVWREVEGRPKVYRIYLPRERASSDEFILKNYHNIKQCTCPEIQVLNKQLQNFLIGQAVQFDLDIVAFEECHAFQRKVLLAEYKIPRGWVSTYGRIAGNLGLLSGARAVGNALAKNPFPIIIPCHRAIKSDGGLGGFQGGLNMKRALLEFEGVKFSASGRAVMDRVYY